MYNRRHRGTSRGFTLIEMIVSVALFAIVMLIAGATLLSLVYANRKAQALQSVMNNLDISLDGMVRAMRMGSNYRCDSQSEPVPPANGDCTNGGDSVYFTPYGADPTNRNDDVGYIYNPTTQRLYEVEGYGKPLAITAPEVSITSMTFYVVGTTPGSEGDTVQPKIVITIKGAAGTNALQTLTTFNIQATATQRLLDL